MTVKTRVIIIPFWIEESMKRAGVPYSDCLDYSKIKKVVSTEDLLTFFSAQEIASTLVGAEYTSCSAWELGSVWNTNMTNQMEDQRKEAANLFEMSLHVNYLEQVKSRLFTPGAAGPDHSPVYEKPYITYDLMPDVVGVVVYPGFFTESTSKELQLSLVDAILKVLYVYNTAYHEVASTLWFKRYLELLAPNGR